MLATRSFFFNTKLFTILFCFPHNNKKHVFSLLIDFLRNTLWLKFYFRVKKEIFSQKTRFSPSFNCTQKNNAFLSISEQKKFTQIENLFYSYFKLKLLMSIIYFINCWDVLFVYYWGRFFFKVKITPRSKVNFFSKPMKNQNLIAFFL